MSNLYQDHAKTRYPSTSLLQILFKVQPSVFYQIIWYLISGSFESLIKSGSLGYGGRFDLNRMTSISGKSIKEIFIVETAR